MENKTELDFKFREMVNVMAVVEKYVRKGKMFTSLDVVNKLFDKNYIIKADRVSSIMNMLFLENEYPELECTFINVVSFKGKVVKAKLYHPIGANVFGYTNINQVKKEREAEDADAVDICEEFLDESFSKLFNINDFKLP